MSSYWKSPYKETSYSGDFKDPNQPLHGSMPRKINLFGNAKGLHFTVPETPHDWYDWANSITTKNSLYHMTRARSNLGKIKGILKTNSDTDGVDSEKVSGHSESRSSTTSKREKKRVTFNESQDDNLSGWSRFQYDRSMSAHHNRLTSSQPLDEFAKQNLKKLLGYVPGAATLPPVSGKGMLTKSSEEMSSSVKCKHNPDLRCANCMNDKNVNTETGENGSNSDLPTPRPEIVNENFEGDQQGVHSESSGSNPAPQLSSTELYPNCGTASPTCQANQNEEFDPHGRSEPKKKLYTHWTKSFMRSPKSNSAMRYNDIVRRYPLSASSLRRISGSPRQGSMRSDHCHTVSKDYTKLHVTGDGKIIRVKQRKEGIHEHNDSNRQAKFRDNFTGSASLQGRYGYKIQATPTHFVGNDVSQRENQTPGSAPSRMKSTHKQTGRDFLESQKEVRMSPCLDKTSQILTWLKDVQQKRNYQPRNSRLYALEPQQLH